MSAPMINILRENYSEIRFVLDSGAFTAWKTGKVIRLDDYCKLIESLPFKPWRYFSLDVIGDAEASLTNYQRMKARGFSPIPIFTRGEDIKMLDEYYKTSDVVGIGGLVGTKGNKGFVKGIMKAVGDRKVHWLGFNAKEFVSHYKPFMCDSSSFTSAFRFASAKIYEGNGKWHTVKKSTFKKKPESKILNLIRSHGVAPERLAYEAEWRNSNQENEHAIETLTFRTWVKYQRDLTEKIGTHFFLACSVEGQIRLMLRAHKYWNEVSQ